MTTPDLRIAGYSPADASTGQALASLTVADLNTVVDHHTPTTSFLLMYDTTATWYDPKPQIRAVAVYRFPQYRTFALDTARHSGFAFAQRWLADRGCPLDAVSVTGSDRARPADAATARIEDKIRADGGRYDLVQIAHEDLGDAWTLLRDRAAKQLPVRVFLQTDDLEKPTYTVREGAFPDTATALAWLENRTGPLPPAPESPPVQRIAAARSRTAHVHADSDTPRPVPAPGTQPMNQRRSL